MFIYELCFQVSHLLTSAGSVGEHGNGFYHFH